VSGRAGYDLLIDKVEAPDPRTVVFQLKFATTAFLPALADPAAFIYKKDILDKDSRWYESHILGSGAFKFAGYETGQSIKGVRNRHQAGARSPGVAERCRSRAPARPCLLPFRG
jgi:peptide/nickel transport system substrate-binding protein